ncbi:MAG: GTP-binding protein [Promethearchaeota archaeon]|nr:MAG: GTP-binding protein [Candidatus Lokiarchaeota archaeon]
MNINVEKGIIVGISTTLEIKIISYPFVIPSDWGRGHVEMLMISLVVDKNYRSELFQDVIDELSERILECPNIYKAFYKDNPEYSAKKGIKEAVSNLNNILSNNYKNIEKIIENPNLGIFLTLGLSKAGKSTLLHYLKTNAFKNMKPTLALQVIKILIDNKIFRTIDVSGQKRLRNQWWSYTKKPDALIFVIDINDSPEGLREAEREFSKIKNRILNESSQLTNTIPLLICLNKIDLIDDAEKKKSKIIDILDLKNSKLNYNVQLTSAKDGIGITDGFKWIFQELLKIE